MLPKGHAPRVGTAGWSIPKQHAAEFPAGGSHLQRYAARLPAVEINSSFYRPHRAATYARWAASVPDDFAFAVKVPKDLTHARRLRDPAEPLERFLGECGALGPKLGVLLVQLPPSLRFDADDAGGFFALLRERHEGPVACEPRHATWLAPDAERLLADFRVARVAAHPPAGAAEAARPGGWEGLVYYRLHGSPRVYYSPYAPERLRETAAALAAHAARGTPAWCVFDNTALGYATADALAVMQGLNGGD